MKLFVRRLLPATIPCVVGLMMGMALVGEAQTYEWSTYAGSSGGIGFRDGPLGVAKVKAIVAVAADAQGTIYLADTLNRVIRKISTVDSMVSTFAGLSTTSGRTDGTGANARLNRPEGMVMTPDGALLVADSTNMNLRKITLGAVVTTLFGNPPVESGAVDGTGAAAAAAADIHTAIPNAGPVTGTYQPDGRERFPTQTVDTSPRTVFLGSFAGGPASGDWTLFVADLSLGNTTVVESWTLNISGVPEPGSGLLALSAAWLLLLRRRRA